MGDDDLFQRAESVATEFQKQVLLFRERVDLAHEQLQLARSHLDDMQDLLQSHTRRATPQPTRLRLIQGGRQDLATKGRLDRSEG
jgi:hypothetical protein